MITTKKYYEYISIILLTNIDRFSAHKDGAREVKDSEDIHQLRVAIRRIRTLISIFKDTFPNKKRKNWDTILKSAAKKLGEARDLDVLLIFLRKCLLHGVTPAKKTGLDIVYHHIQSRREILQQKVISILDLFEKKKTLKKIKKSIVPLTNKKAPSYGQLYTLAPKTIQIRLNALLTFKKYVLKPEKKHELHQMRIAAKKLRYTLETFHHLYGKKIDRFIEPAKIVQQELGCMHDFDVWIDILPGQIQEENTEDLKPALVSFTTTCRKLRAQIYTEFVQTWKTLEQEHVWEELQTFLKSKTN